MSKLLAINRSLPDRILRGKLSRSHKFTSTPGTTVLRISIMIMISVLMLSTFSSSVLAAETRTVDGWIRIDPDTDEMTVNYTWNMSDPSNSYLFNWNQTVDPFEQDNNLTGSFTGTFLPPIEFQVTKYVDNLTLLGLVKFKSTWIMSGSTGSWWRIPCQGPGWGDSANLTIWHIDSPATLEVTDSAMPNNISHPVKVFDQDFDMDAASLNKSVRYWNGTAWDRPFNSTWVRVGAQIHTDEFYLVRWVIYNNGDLYQVRFSSTDQCEDRVFKTWVIQHDGTKEIYEADLDFSVLHILGMGYAVWGDEIQAQRDIIYQEYFEGIDGTPLDTYDPAWSVIKGGSSVAEIDDAQAPGGGSTSLLLYRDGTNGVTVYRTISMTTDFSSFRFFIRAAQTNCNQDFSLRQVGENKVYCLMSAGNFRFSHGNGVGGSNTVIVPYVADTDYEIWLDIYFTNNKYRAWINGIMYPGPNADAQGFDNFGGDRTATAIDNFRAYLHSGTGSVWFDTIKNLESDRSTITWNIELDEPVTEWDYLTVMVPFLDVVDNSTNVRIGFGTQNDSWSTFWWVAENGPTDFGIKSVQWDVAWPATDMKIEMTIYNRSRSLWIMDHNPDFNPDIPWSDNRYTVDPHEWAPDDYYFGGVPYHSMQVTNGSWENTYVSGTYYLEGREVDPDQLFEKRQDSDNWLIEIFYTGYRGIARVTAAFSFGMTGHMDRVWDILDPDTPFPLDAPWYLGKYYFKSLIWLSEFASGLGDLIWSGLCWLYEAGAWIVNAASWVFAGIATLIVLMIIPPVWSRFFKAVWGLIKFGWILAQDGVLAASEFADTFWKDFMTTSYVTRIAKRIPIKRRG